MLLTWDVAVRLLYQTNDHTQQHYLQAINCLEKLAHGPSILGHTLHKVRLFLHGFQGTDGSCGQVGRQRGAVTVAKARQALVVDNVSVPGTETSNGRQRVACTSSTFRTSAWPLQGAWQIASEPHCNARHSVSRAHACALLPVQLQNQPSRHLLHKCGMHSHVLHFRVDLADCVKSSQTQSSEGMGR